MQIDYCFTTWLLYQVARHQNWTLLNLELSGIGRTVLTSIKLMPNKLLNGSYYKIMRNNSNSWTHQALFRCKLFISIYICQASLLPFMCATDRFHFFMWMSAVIGIVVSTNLVFIMTLSIFRSSMRSLESLTRLISEFLSDIAVKVMLCLIKKKEALVSLMYD